MEWKTIETAPKDGTRILVYQDGEMEVADWYTHKYPATYTERPDGLYEKNETEGSSWWNANECQHPTHWMPLPAPPLTTAKGIEDEASTAS
jgi:hypothetical protein